MRDKIIIVEGPQGARENNFYKLFKRKGCSI